MAGSCQNSIILFVLVLHVRKDNDEVKWWWLPPHHLWVNMLDLQHVTWVSGLMGRLLLHHAVMCLCFHLIINGGTCGPLTDLIGPTALMAVYEWCTISSFAMSTQGHSHGLTSIYFKKKRLYIISTEPESARYNSPLVPCSPNLISHHLKLGDCSCSLQKDPMLAVHLFRERR